jgi:glutathione S-transferase
MFPEYLQWFHYCEGMVMPPVNTIVVHTLLLPEERRDESVLAQARKLLTRSLRIVNDSMGDKEYLAGDFSAADIMLGHSIYMSNRLGCVTDDMDKLKAYIKRVEQRPAFQKAMAS